MVCSYSSFHQRSGFILREMSEGPPPPYWEKSDLGAQAGPGGPPGEGGSDQSSW